MEKNLAYVAESVASMLADSIESNIERYMSVGFGDLAADGSWRLALSVRADLGPLEKLKPASSAADDIYNTKLVWAALGHITPSVACENRFWLRLSHVECIDYSRARWLSVNDPIEKSVKSIGKHFFAWGRTGWRDDHAISRLWWNMWLAGRIYPQDPDFALTTLFRSADMRQSFVERPWMFGRKSVASGLLRLLHKMPDLASDDLAIRRVMKQINLRGAGLVFESMPQQKIDAFMSQCADAARE